MVSLSSLCISLINCSPLVFIHVFFNSLSNYFHSTRPNASIKFTNVNIHKLRYVLRFYSSFQTNAPPGYVLCFYSSFQTNAHPGYVLCLYIGDWCLDEWRSLNAGAAISETIKAFILYTLIGVYAKYVSNLDIDSNLNTNVINFYLYYVYNFKIC